MYRNTKKGPKRGVSLYSYSAEFGFEKTLEDCFEDVYDMGAHGIEILANIHIENYPCPTQEWADKWFALLDKYQLEPVEYHDIQYGFCCTHSYMPPFLESAADPDKPEMVYMPEMGHNLHQRRLLIV